MPELPLIESGWTHLLWAVLMLLAALGFWGDLTRIGRNVSGAAIILAASMALSNFGVMPKSAPAYDVVWTYLVPLAIPLLLLKADLRRVVAETRTMLLAFALGAAGTVAGALLGFAVLSLGEQAGKLAGVFTATFIGGSMNFAAVTQAVELDPALATAALAADNVVGVLYLALLALLPSLAWFGRWYRQAAAAGPDAPAVNDEPAARVALDLPHVGLGLGLSFAICAVGQALAGYFGVSGYAILFITALTVIVANLFPRQLAALKGDYEIGLFFMYVFFATIGLSADVATMLDKAIVVAAYAALILACHAAVIFGVSRLFRLDLMEVVIASNACAAGPATAAALAAGKQRPDLVAPAVLLGVFGYAIANFIGIGISAWLGS